jgi:signal transduction histidine kinase/CheY-like chemotaxis protein
LFELAAGLADPKRRGEAARALARRAGAEDLVVFVVDAEIGVLLPAPGFRQTLPDSGRWLAFLADVVAARGPLAGTLPYPARGVETAALGVAGADGSVLVLLGGRPVAAVALGVGVVLPILAAAFRGEQALLAAEGRAAVARDAAGHARLLAASLESARHALQRALGAAEAANKAKDQFLAVLSHELRTPLGPVLTTATALLTDEKLPPELRESLEMIRRNAELEARLIDDLLDLTRVAKGKMPLSLDVVDVHALVRQTLEICRSDVYRKMLRVTVRLDAAEHFVRADPARLQQVLWNLVKNAVKFTPAEGRLEIVSADVAGRLRIEVSDTGIGIEPGHLEKIFDAFEQTGDAVTHRFGGLGLGLAISKALVDAHGGELVASSGGKGLGATFSVSLATVPQPLAVAQPPGATPLPDGARRLRLLLVEDHGDTAKVMSRLLSNLGHDVAVAGSIARALQLGEGQPFDLVLSDLGLPDGSGLDLMRQLHKRFGLAGVAISGYGMEDDVRQSSEAGFIAHLTKPVNFQKVRALLAAFGTAGTAPAT